MSLNQSGCSSGDVRHQLLDHPRLPRATRHLQDSSTLGACVQTVALTWSERLHITIAVSGCGRKPGAQPDADGAQHAA